MMKCKIKRIEKATESHLVGASERERTIIKENWQNIIQIES